MLETLPRLGDMNAPVYACAYLLILDEIAEDPHSIAESELFKTLMTNNRISSDDDKRKSALLFHVFFTILAIRLSSPPASIARSTEEEQIYT